VSRRAAWKLRPLPQPARGNVRRSSYRRFLKGGKAMVEVTRLDGKPYYINPHQIEYIESNPDTTLVMLSGKRLVVKEDYPTIFRRIVEYRKLIGAFKNEE
jgi:flagellar protein FlbD